MSTNDPSRNLGLPLRRETRFDERVIVAPLSAMISANSKAVLCFGNISFTSNSSVHSLSVVTDDAVIASG